jgi:hypothetical protein
MTAPIDDFIPRTLDTDLADILLRFSKGLEELVNFGSQVLNWDMDRENGGDEDLPAILFLRNFLEQIDGISILIKHSSVEPCKPLLRTALENFFSLEYLLQEDSHNRAMSFLVWNAITTEKWIRKADGKSKDFLEASAKYKKDKMMNQLQPLIVPDTEAMLATVQKMLELPKYKSVVEEYEKCKKAKKNPTWYNLFGGPNNLEDLANRVGLPALYDVLYRGWSGSTHGNNIVQGNLDKDESGQAKLIQIRNPSGAQTVTQHCTNISIMAFRIFIEKRMPQKMPEFKKWYNEIRNFNLSLAATRAINVK